MNCRRVFALAILVILTTVLPAVAQQEDAERETSFTHWEWAQGLTFPEKTAGKFYAFLVPPEVLGRAQTRLDDLRIGDAKGQRVPFALRELRKKEEKQILPTREFNKGAGKGYYQVDLEITDMGRPNYNEIEIDTSGTDFHRKVEVFGDDDPLLMKPRAVLHGEGKKNARFLVHYHADAGVVDVRKFRFDVTQYRYLRVLVHADASTSEEVPKINHVAVRRTIEVPGTYLTRPATLGDRQGVPGPSSAWFINLGEQVPVEGLSFRVNGPEVDRPFRLEIARPDEKKANPFGLDRPQPLGVEWRWRRVGKDLFLDATFAEVFARRLRLVIADYANEPMNLDPAGVQYTSCARQVVFELPAEKGFTLPLKLYYGNPEAQAPRYDIAARLPAVLTPAPQEVQLGRFEQNPEYQPRPKPWSEQYPWLIYVILSIACLALLTILGLLAKQAIARADAAPRESNS
jgi:hypothetical protein